MIANKELIALTLLAGVETAGVFGNLCPGVPDLNRSVRDGSPYLRQDLNHAYVHATVLGLSLAGIVSVLAGSPLPMLAGGIAAGAMVMTYETALPPEMRLLPWGNVRNPEIIDGTFRVID